MQMMLTELCAEMKNYFLCNREADIHVGDYVIENGALQDVDFLQNGQYFRIAGSIFNDGVYQYPTNELSDEAFTGAIWAMAVPPAVVALAAEIEEWQTKNADVLNSPYTSESFGGYSYSKGSSTTGAGGYTWKDHFSARLTKYRRISVL